MKSFTTVLSLAVLVMAQQSIAQSSEVYRFERMWPTLQQPWYILPWDIQVLDDDAVYINPLSNHRQELKSFSSSGNLISSVALDDSAFFFSFAIDGEGNYYAQHTLALSDPEQRYIQKYDPDGQLLHEFGRWGTEPGEFQIPLQDFGGTNIHLDMAFDHNNNVYVTDPGNHRIQVFSPEGKLINSWGQSGSEPGEFIQPYGIAIDSSNKVYVLDAGNSRIQVFSTAGEFIFEFGSPGSEQGQFQFDLESGWGGLAVDPAENIYVVNGSFRTGVQKFDPAGNFLFEIDPAQPDINKFDQITEIDTDSSGNLYVANPSGQYVAKFDSQGVLLNRWGATSERPGFFDFPMAIERGSNGLFYVVDFFNDRIQMFTEAGSYQGEFGGIGSQSGELSHPRGVALAANGDVYVADTENRRIQVFSASGEFQFGWEMEPLENGQFGFSNPWHIEIAASGEVYVATTEQTNDQNYEIQKYSAQGTFLDRWIPVHEGTEIIGLSDIDIGTDNTFYVIGFKPETFARGVYTFNLEGDSIGYPYTEAYYQMHVDDENIYLATASNGEVDVFSLAGDFIGTIGESGINAGQFEREIDLTTFGNSIYLADTHNHRIQKFNVGDIGNRSKAIVVAAGGGFNGNNLWDATQLSANFAYRTLTYQGFTKDSIYYLSSDLDLDLDQNGVADDVDADATNANLQFAITEWASDADNLLIYLVDHGGVNTFRMQADEVLSASELATWVNALQETLPGRVTLIYDACESGTFMSAMTPPAGVERTVVTSTSPGENAVFVSQGSISFSNYFWTHVFNGLSLENAFTLASEALTATTDHQTPMLDYNGDGISDSTDLVLSSGVFIGNGTDLQASAPDVFSVSSAQVISGTATATIEATGVEDDDGIARVWAIARPPDYQQGSSGNPVQDLPSFDLTGQGNGRYVGSWDGFNSAGTYQLAVYASDRIGNTSVPVLTTVSVESPLSKRAILVAAGAANDPDYPRASGSTDVAYEALRQQGYDDEAINYMSHIGTQGVDVSPSLDNLELAISNLNGSDTQDLVLYITGPGDRDSLTISTDQVLSSTQLSTWLDQLSETVPGNVTVVLDSDHSGSFVSALSRDKRIIVTGSSAEQQAHFFSDGDISFSNFYWRKVFNGSTVRDAWVFANRAMRFAAESQEAQLDDDGDGVANTKSDGELARFEIHGTGILLAGDDPLISTISNDQTISVGDSHTVSVSGVTTTGSISAVSAVVTAPDQQVNSFALAGSGDNYTLDGVAFSTPGTYDIAVYAEDSNGNISLPIISEVTVQEEGFDLQLNANEDALSAGDILSLSTSAIIGARDYEGPVDIYLSITLPDGTLYYIANLALDLALAPTPILAGWTPATLPATELFAIPLPSGLIAGDYSWKITFTRAGESISTSASWLAQGRAVHGVQ